MRCLPALTGVLIVLAGAGCGSGAAGTERPGATIKVVAAENVWGSIAAQLAGAKGAVTSVVDNPETDPHDYSPTAADARALAGADVAIVNGIGYDPWASRLLDANPVSSRTVLDVGELLHLREGDNPHQWYDPASVRKVVDAISAAYVRADPAHAAYFASRKRLFNGGSLHGYDRLRAEIRKRFAGVPVGYSESIFEPLGADLGLKLATPESFAKSVTEGTDVSAADAQTVDRQVQRRQIRAWIFNGQNVTPDVQRINEASRENHIPVVTITETLSPATAGFQQWQVAQLRALRAALHRATGR